MSWAFATVDWYVVCEHGLVFATRLEVPHLVTKRAHRLEANGDGQLDNVVPGDQPSRTLHDSLLERVVFDNSASYFGKVASSGYQAVFRTG